MRFYNHKHNCYIKAEGSFIGQICEMEMKRGAKIQSQAKQETDSTTKKTHDYKLLQNDGNY